MESFRQEPRNYKSFRQEPHNYKSFRQEPRKYKSFRQEPRNYKSFRQIPLWDLFEEKLDLWDGSELVLERFLRTAVCCSGKDTCTDSTDAARLMDLRESEESLLPLPKPSTGVCVQAYLSIDDGHHPEPAAGSGDGQHGPEEDEDGKEENEVLLLLPRLECNSVTLAHSNLCPQVQGMLLLQLP
ncbi:hypothetical protein AAY473_017291, partial [Plecturocebus cupreus]